MNYHLNREGQNLGGFPIEELRRRRQAGELTGGELVWCKGMPAWQPLDSVLQENALDRKPTPPPIPPSAAKPQTNRALVVAIVAGVLVVLAGLALVGVMAAKIMRRVRPILSTMTAGEQAEGAITAASKPVVWTTNALTEAKRLEQRREFRFRQWLEGYKQRGQRNAEYDTNALGLIGNWIAMNYGGVVDSNQPPLAELSDKLAGDSACADPLVLTAAAVNTVELQESIRRLERAVRGFENSKHRAYPKFYATVILAGKITNDRMDRQPVLDAAAVELFKEMFKDGSLLPADQMEIADILLDGWGNAFFWRHAATLYPIPRRADQAYEWLSLAMEGELDVDRAWNARGSGWANEVSEQGWQGFREHLAKASECFTRAWELRPDLPLPASRMIKVAMGDAGVEEMRTWFDRATAAQIDYPQAWSNMRWGLRPRWHGSREAMLAFGITAINTRRFDTDVPRMFFDVVADLEAELDVKYGQHIYGREDIWPHAQDMYEGYIAEPTQAASQYGWRSSYSVVAYLAGKYDVARKQLEAINWQPKRWNLSGWGTDLSLMPLEVAARTGPLASRVDTAESSYRANDLARAWRLYSELTNATNADDRTRAFIRDRLATLALEQRLQKGEWVDFLPSGADFPGWCLARGQFKQLSDGALEVQCDQQGHMLYSRVRIGTDFEVKGSFEVVRSSTKAFQAGLVLGAPNLDSYVWDAFRVMRNDDEGDVASFSQCWSKRQVLGPATLNGKTNSFYFRFQGGRANATVNNKEVLNAVKPPANSYLPANEFLLGLGAFNDMNNTVIRYRDIQVRKLSTD
jgi:hypothetical protein